MDLNRKAMEFERFAGVAEEKITILERKVVDLERRLNAAEEEIKKLKGRS